MGISHPFSTAAAVVASYGPTTSQAQVLTAFSGLDMSYLLRSRLQLQLGIGWLPHHRLATVVHMGASPGLLIVLHIGATAEKGY